MEGLTDKTTNMVTYKAGQLKVASISRQKWMMRYDIIYMMRQWRKMRRVDKSYIKIAFIQRMMYRDIRYTRVSNNISRLAHCHLGPWFDPVSTSVFADFSSLLSPPK